MRIESVAVKLPSRKVTNDDIFAFIEEASPDVSRVVRQTYLRMTRTLLDKCGAKTRFIRDKEKKEKAQELILAAMREALAKASMDKDDIDLIIYCGVGKGFLEPANAYFYADAMKMHASCYDVVDACMSWIRALEIAYHFLMFGKYQRIMVINGEFNAYDHGFPELFEIQSLSQLEYTFPTYTIGEAASATILTRSGNEWTFDFKSVPALCDLCTIPLEGYRDYVNGSKKFGLNGINKFVSFGGQLFSNADKYLTDLLRQCVKDVDEPVLYIPHAASSKAYESSARGFIDLDKMFTRVFPEYGNLVSASVPAGIHLALEEGRLKRGDKIVLCPASAGMVFSVTQLTY